MSLHQNQGVPRFLHPTWAVEVHPQVGLGLWNSQKAGVFLTSRQTSGVSDTARAIEEDLRRLCGRTTLCADRLDYLLEKQEQIPDTFKNMHVCFWGSRFRARGTDGSRFIRVMYHTGRRFDSYAHFIARGFTPEMAAAVYSD